jgi:hypothetical protein
VNNSAGIFIWADLDHQSILGRISYLRCKSMKQEKQMEVAVPGRYVWAKCHQLRVARLGSTPLLPLSEMGLSGFGLGAEVSDWASSGEGAWCGVWWAG